MAGLSDDFLRFLQANYPDDFRLIPSGDVPEALVNSMMSKHAAHYAIWCQIPEWIKNNFHDKLPKEVLNGNETVQEFIHKEEVVKKEEKNNGEMISYSVELLALGYTTDAVSTLMADRKEREAMLLALGDRPMTPEEMDLWLETRSNDMDAILQDWQNNQPEKYTFYLAKALSREVKRLDRGELTNDERDAAEKRVHVLERGLTKAAKRLKSREVRQNMVDYLRGQSQQSALRSLSPDVLAAMTALMREQGIRIQKMDGKTKVRTNRWYDSLTDSLKKDFARMEKSENIFRERTRRDKQHMVRIKAHEMLDKQNDGIAKVVHMRRSVKRETA